MLYLVVMLFGFRKKWAERKATAKAKTLLKLPLLRRHSLIGQSGLPGIENPGQPFSLSDTFGFVTPLNIAEKRWFAKLFDTATDSIMRLR